MAADGHWAAGSDSLMAGLPVQGRPVPTATLLLLQPPPPCLGGQQHGDDGRGCTARSGHNKVRKKVHRTYSTK